MPRPEPVTAPTALPPAVVSATAQPGQATGLRRIAKFITADVAQSQLTLAADGKLPELHLNLDESKAKKRKSDGGGGGGQWRILMLLPVSLGLCGLILLAPSGPSGGSDVEQQRARARIASETYLGREDRELKPYQLYLREAQQAFARGDRETERRYYQRVLSLLRDESLKPADKNLTGMKTHSNDPELASDEDLEERISILLKNP